MQHHPTAAAPLAGLLTDAERLAAAFADAARLARDCAEVVRSAAGEADDAMAELEEAVASSLARVRGRAASLSAALESHAAGLAGEAAEGYRDREEEAEAEHMRALTERRDAVVRAGLESLNGTAGTPGAGIEWADDDVVALAETPGPIGADAPGPCDAPACDVAGLPGEDGAPVAAVATAGQHSGRGKKRKGKK